MDCWIATETKFELVDIRNAMGSVKDLAVLKAPEGNNSGLGRFNFSDRYSVFDWGEMPDLIKNKGRALCIIGAYFFEKLESAGIKTHYVGLVEDEKPKKLAGLKNPSNIMEVRLVRVVEPQFKNNAYDYSAYNSSLSNYLIPLEVIYRNSLPEGASIFKRLKEGDIKLADLGLNKMPSPGDVLERPILDLSTKLEATDRYVSWAEAARVAALSEAEVDELKKVLLQVDQFITSSAGRMGLVNCDGKIEFAFDSSRKMMLVDVLGTPDECRFTFPLRLSTTGFPRRPIRQAHGYPASIEGIPVSKEAARIYYRKTEWYKAVEEAKKKDRIGWKKFVNVAPEPLPPRFAELLSFIYQSFCNELTERRWFDSPLLKKVLLEVKNYL